MELGGVRRCDSWAFVCSLSVPLSGKPCFNSVEWRHAPTPTNSNEISQDLTASTMILVTFTSHKGMLCSSE